MDGERQGEERAGTAGAANVNVDEKDYIFLLTQNTCWCCGFWILSLRIDDYSTPPPPPTPNSSRRSQSELRPKKKKKEEGRKEGRKAEWKDCI